MDRGYVFPKSVTGHELFFAASYSKPALVIEIFFCTNGYKMVLIREIAIFAIFYLLCRTRFTTAFLDVRFAYRLQDITIDMNWLYTTLVIYNVGYI